MVRTLKLIGPVFGRPEYGGRNMVGRNRAKRQFRHAGDYQLSLFAYPKAGLAKWPLPQQRSESLSAIRARYGLLQRFHAMLSAIG